VPIIPDEARTFGVDALFREIGIYSPKGQLYEPVDKKSLLYYNETKDGTAPGGGNHRGGFDGVIYRRGRVVRHSRAIHDPSIFIIRCSAFSRIGDLNVAGGRHQSEGLSARATAAGRP